MACLCLKVLGPTHWKGKTDSGKRPGSAVPQFHVILSNQSLQNHGLNLAVDCTSLIKTSMIVHIFGN